MGPNPVSSRRVFLGTSLAAGAAWVWPSRAEAAYSLRLGYAAITWNGKDDQAIDDVAALGFHGIQLRTSSLEIWGTKPEALKKKLAEKKVKLLCFSSGTVDAIPEKEAEYLASHEKNARFVAAAGGKLLQLVSRRPADREPTPEEFARVGKLLNAIGKRTQAHGVKVVYHNHMNGFGETPDGLDRVLAATDPKLVGLLFDIAHCQQGGGDPVAGVAKHKDRIAILHLKDVVSPLPGDTKPPHDSYRFVELGQGKVDVPGVLAAVKKIGFHGPAVIELDAVSDKSRTAKDCAEINKRYVVEKLGLTL
jgi:inosose dehydratase